MATQRQKRLARLIIENAGVDKPINGGEMLEKVGYSKTMATAKVKDVLKSNGVLEELEHLGFSVEGADSVVKSLLYKGKKEETKIKAAQEVYKRLGAYEDTKQSAGKNLVIVISGESANRYAINPPRGPETGSA